jgi:hypothetical protein
MMEPRWISTPAAVAGFARVRDQLSGARAEAERLRGELARVRGERDRAVAAAVVLQTRGGRARRSLSVDEAISVVFEVLGVVPIGPKVAAALAAHDRRSAGERP